MRELDVEVANELVGIGVGVENGPVREVSFGKDVGGSEEGASTSFSGGGRIAV
jgi:hypothetical protein